MTPSRFFRFNSRSNLFALALAVGGAAHADTEAFQWHGFGSQGIFHTSDNAFGGDSDDRISTDYNELGANLAYSPLQSLRLSGQAVVRNAGDYDVGRTRIDYLQADYAFLSHGDNKAGIRIGRIKNNFGFYNATRDVAHTRPSIYLPHNIYWEPIRDMLLSRDGGSVYWDTYANSGLFSFELGYGEPRVTKQMATEMLFFPVSHIETDNARLGLARAGWEDNSGQWRLALTGLGASSDLDVGLIGEFEARYLLASLQYSTESWQLTGELAWFNYDLKMDPFTRNSYGDAAYLQYNYFLSPALQVFARFDIGYFDRQNRNGSSFEPFVPRHIGFNRDSGVGVRWDIDPYWMVMVEAHYLEGGLSLSTVDNPDIWDTERYWTLTTAEIAFRF